MYKLETKDLVLKNKDNTVALNGITANFESGKLNAIIGPSGSGKSALANILYGHSKSTISTSGKILIDGNQRNEDDWFRISSLIQKESSLYKSQLVCEVLQFTLTIYNCNNKTNKKLTDYDDLIVALHLKECFYTSVNILSTVKMHLLSVCCELIMMKKIIILDDVTMDYDHASALNLVLILRKLAIDMELLIILTVETPSESLMGTFDNVVLLDGGRLIYNGSSSKIVSFFTNKNIIKPPEMLVSEFIYALIYNKTECKHFNKNSIIKFLDQVKGASDAVIDNSIVTNKKEKDNTDKIYYKMGYNLFYRFFTFYIRNFFFQLKLEALVFLPVIIYLLTKGLSNVEKEISFDSTKRSDLLFYTVLAGHSGLLEDDYNERMATFYEISSVISDSITDSDDYTQQQESIVSQDSLQSMSDDNNVEGQGKINKKFTLDIDSEMGSQQEKDIDSQISQHLISEGQKEINKKFTLDIDSEMGSQQEKDIDSQISQHLISEGQKEINKKFTLDVDSELGSKQENFIDSQIPHHLISEGQKEINKNFTLDVDSELGSQQENFTDSQIPQQLISEDQNNEVGLTKEKDAFIEETFKTIKRLYNKNKTTLTTDKSNLQKKISITKKMFQQKNLWVVLEYPNYKKIIEALAAEYYNPLDQNDKKLETDSKDLEERNALAKRLSGLDVVYLNQLDQDDWKFLEEYKKKLLSKFIAKQNAKKNFFYEFIMEKVYPIKLRQFMCIVLVFGFYPYFMATSDSVLSIMNTQIQSEIQSRLYSPATLCFANILSQIVSYIYPAFLTSVSLLSLDFIFSLPNYCYLIFLSYFSTNFITNIFIDLLFDTNSCKGRKMGYLKLGLKCFIPYSLALSYIYDLSRFSTSYFRTIKKVIYVFISLFNPAHFLYCFLLAKKLENFTDNNVELISRMVNNTFSANSIAPTSLFYIRFCLESNIFSPINVDLAVFCWKLVYPLFHNEAFNKDIFLLGFVVSMTVLIKVTFYLFSLRYKPSNKLQI